MISPSLPPTTPNPTEKLNGSTKKSKSTFEFSAEITPPHGQIQYLMLNLPTTTAHTLSLHNCRSFSWWDMNPMPYLLLQFSFFILVSFCSLHFLYIVPGILLILSPLTFFLSLDLTQFFSVCSKTFDDIATLLLLMSYSITFYEVPFLT